MIFTHPEHSFATLIETNRHHCILKLCGLYKNVNWQESQGLGLEILTQIVSSECYEFDDIGVIDMVLEEIHV
ncbi:MAG: hypothetical protein A2Z14_08370 [Chloroflexi bacterium RBG_16_48_8]|nr:MAG: hypothetical protein A2Z14_08370 [Chloroflexi bacterium RBG_16_48_8]